MRFIVKDFVRYRALFLLLLPGTLLLLVLNYIPMLGLLIAFKNFKFYENNFFINFFKSEWVGFYNFKFFIVSPDAIIITRNVVLYNIAFIVIGTAFSVLAAIALNEMKGKILVRVYQTSMLFPYFLSWIVISYLFFAFLSVDRGIINMTILEALGKEGVEWYNEKVYWPFILVFANLLKYGGYNSVIYLAAITGIDTEYYEAATIDGASRLQQMKSITIPLLSPVITIMVLLGIGRIFNADFGLFYQLPMNQGALFDVTNVIDTYVYRALQISGDLNMSSAAGLYQAIVGFVLVLTANLVVRKIDKEKALF